MHLDKDGTKDSIRTKWNGHQVRQPNFNFLKNVDSHPSHYTTAHISFTVDDIYMGVVPTGDGYFRRGGFSGYNPWANGGLDAPFDREVNYNSEKYFQKKST